MTPVLYACASHVVLNNTPTFSPLPVRPGSSVALSQVVGYGRFGQRPALYASWGSCLHFASNASSGRRIRGWGA